MSKERIIFFSEKYSNGKVWQVDMKIPRGNRGVKGVYGAAPVRDRALLWENGVIPYTLEDSVRKYREKRAGRVEERRGEGFGGWVGVRWELAIHNNAPPPTPIGNLGWLCCGRCLCFYVWPKERFSCSKNHTMVEAWQSPACNLLLVAMRQMNIHSFTWRKPLASSWRLSVVAHI